MVGWHHPLNGHKFSKLQEVGDGQGGLGCLASLVAQTVKRLPAMQDPGFDSWVGKIPWRRIWQSTPALLPGKSHGRRSLIGYVHRVAKSWTRLSYFTFTFSKLHYVNHQVLFGYTLRVKTYFISLIFYFLLSFLNFILFLNFTKLY